MSDNIKCDRVIIEVVNDLKNNRNVIINKYKELQLATMAGIEPYAEFYTNELKDYEADPNEVETDQVLQYIRYDIPHTKTVYIFIDRHASDLFAIFEHINVDKLDLSNVFSQLPELMSLDSAFMNVVCKELNVNNIVSKRLTNLNQTFMNAVIDNLIGIETWPSQNVYVTASMFNNAIIKSALNFDTWHSPCCQNISSMFTHAKLDFLSFNVKLNSCKLNYLFHNANIKKLDVHNFEVTDMMLYSSVFDGLVTPELILDKFDTKTSKNYSYSAAYLFAHCRIDTLKTIIKFSDINISKTTWFSKSNIKKLIVPYLITNNKVELDEALNIMFISSTIDTISLLPPQNDTEQKIIDQLSNTYSMIQFKYLSNKQQDQYHPVLNNKGDYIYE